MRRLRDSLPQSWGLRAGLALIVVLFVAARFEEELRSNVLAEAWGVFGAGLIVWWWTEQQSESIQREAWMCANPELIGWTLDDVETLLAGPLAWIQRLLSVPPGVMEKAIGATTHRRRLNAVHQITALLTQKYDQTISASPEMVSAFLNDAYATSARVSGDLRRVKAFEASPVVARLPELQLALTSFALVCESFPRGHNDPDTHPKPRESSQADDLGVIQRYLHRALQLYVSCSKLRERLGQVSPLAKAGFLRGVIDKQHSPETVSEAWRESPCSHRDGS